MGMTDLPSLGVELRPVRNRVRSFLRCNHDGRRVSLEAQLRFRKVIEVDYGRYFVEMQSIDVVDVVIVVSELQSAFSSF